MKFMCLTTSIGRSRDLESIEMKYDNGRRMVGTMDGLKDGRAGGIMDRSMGGLKGGRTEL
jgi:hypothetical protein